MALGMSVAEAQERISSAEFTEWCAYDRIEPYGPERVDFLAAMICDTVAKAAGVKTTKPADFMPRFDRVRKRQTVAEMRANFRAFVEAHNWSLRRGKAQGTD